MTDEYNSSQNSVNYKLLKSGTVTCESAEGYGTLSAFQLSSKLRARRRAYFMSGDYLYCFLVDVFPPAKYEERGKEIDSIIKSLRLGD